MKKERLEPGFKQLQEDEKNLLSLIVQDIKAGKTILYPADSIWGIGCDATNEASVEKIYQIKKRDADKPMIVLVHSEKMLQDLVDVPEMAWQLLDVAENPLTLIYDAPKGLAKNVVGKVGSIGIRLVKSGLVHHIIKLSNRPLVSTSANMSGEKTPLAFHTISEKIKEKVETIVNPTDFASFSEEYLSGKASSIIRIWNDGRIKVIRE